MHTNSWLVLQLQARKWLQNTTKLPFLQRQKMPSKCFVRIPYVGVRGKECHLTGFPESHRRCPSKPNTDDLAGVGCSPERTEERMMLRRNPRNVNAVVIRAHRGIKKQQKIYCLQNWTRDRNTITSCTIYVGVLGPDVLEIPCIAHDTSV